ncbi:cyclase [Prosthecochloris sp. GSB1]|uniref:SRPBCC family protein n=1 Tax=Prosthecochloris sp. GSB1 TaxID=281093 RepID=UPI000B8C9316|nr:SRPBCC family protein [Prosthecochloris sp. GSB1]ASQ90036.1 cyclase [Prosthecochloris sp. GSB1]
MTGKNKSPLTDTVREKLLRGETHVAVSFRENGLIDAEGAIYIAATAETVWNILTDYDRLAETIPKVAESRLVEERGDEKIVDQTGRSGFLFIEKSVRILLEVREQFPRRLSFEQIEGDFSMYRGEWRFLPDENGAGVFVGWSATLKPDFFAPPFLVSFVQYQDLPTVLRAIKRLAENATEKDGNPKR